MNNEVEVLPPGQQSTAVARIFSSNPASVIANMRDNMDGERLTAWDLDRLKVPPGGQQLFQVQTRNGIVGEQRVQAVIVYTRKLRSFWRDAYSGGNAPPDCASMDCVIGMGQPCAPDRAFADAVMSDWQTDRCAAWICIKCPFAQFGSARDVAGQPAPGQACKEIRQLFILTPYSKMPLLLVVPPTSMKYAKKYFFSLMGNDIPPHSALTNITLGLGKSQKGLPYSTVNLSFGGELNSDQVQAAAMWRETVIAMVQTMPMDITDYEVVRDPKESEAV